MSVLTRTIPVYEFKNQPPVQNIQLIVDSEEIAARFDNAYLERFESRNHVLTFGGYIVDGVRQPVSKDTSMAMTSWVSAPYRARRNTKWDDLERGRFDYRTCAFVRGIEPPVPMIDMVVANCESVKEMPLNPDQVISEVIDTLKVKEYLPEENPIVQLAKKYVNNISQETLREFFYSFGDDGTKFLTIIISL